MNSLLSRTPSLGRVKTTLTFLCCAGAAILLMTAATSQAEAPDSDSVTKPVAEAEARGLIGGKLTSDLRMDAVPEPPTGIEVDEYRAQQTGNAQDADLQMWTEPFGDDNLHIEIGRRADGASVVSWWVLPKPAPGCLLYVYKIFDKSGHVVRSEYWSRNNVVKTNTGTDFPPEIYPFGPYGGLPASEITRALDPVAKGSSGRLYTQFSFDGYVPLDVWADNVEDVTVPAGHFKALHVVMRPEASTFLPSWPGFVLKVIDQFMPRESFCFEAAPPHRFLEFEGVPGPSGPKLSTELIRYWTAGSDGHAGARAPIKGD